VKTRRNSKPPQPERGSRFGEALRQLPDEPRALPDLAPELKRDGHHFFEFFSGNSRMNDR
jgi:hypothetical protein